MASILDRSSSFGIFLVAKNDMQTNAHTLAGLAEDAGDGSTLQDLVDLEVQSGRSLQSLVDSGKTASCALMWLQRSLRLIAVMLAVCTCSCTCTRTHTRTHAHTHTHAIRTRTCSDLE